MMMLHRIRLATSLTTLAFLVAKGASFTTPSATTTTTNRPSSSSLAAPPLVRLQQVASSDAADSSFLGQNAMITPEGYGFSTPASRVLREAARSGGYYKASGADRVIDVVQQITVGGQYDVALVFEQSAETGQEELLGLFTETDYIQFSQERNLSTNEQESASFLTLPVRDYVTPKDELLAISSSNTANVAIATMNMAAVRHLVVADQVSSDGKLLENAVVEGVMSMQDVLGVIQQDERLSLQTLAKKYPNMPDPLEQLREQLRSDANRAARNPETAKQDALKVGVSALAAAFAIAFFSQSGWLHDHADLAMIGIFCLGYIGIIFEDVVEADKAGIALLMSTGLWITYADFFQSTGQASAGVLEQLSEQLAEVSDICFFLLAASTIVEVVDAHQGFKVVTNRIQTTSKKELFWIVGFLTFFLSAILNNLTVTIVMVSLLRKLVPLEEDRRLFGAMVVVAANAGGVWTPIGDVTTTMLWINNQLSTIPTITELFLPSIVCLVASLAFLVNQVEEDESLENSTLPEPSPLSARGQLVFGAGIACLLSVPVFAELTGLPPYLAMLTGLGAMFVLTDIIHLGNEKEGEQLRVPAALSKLDISGILFFLGILMSIGVLDKSGLLKELAVFLSNTLPSLDIIATVIGLASALIDNVPLVAATMGMYDLSDYATDDRLWQLIALCAGTGGSILVIGSASGVALMGLEKVDFLWYARKVSVGAAVGYFAGIAAYIAQTALLSGAGLQGVLPQVAMATDTMMQQTVGVM